MIQIVPFANLFLLVVAVIILMPSSLISKPEQSWTDLNMSDIDEKKRFDLSQWDRRDLCSAEKDSKTLCQSEIHDAVKKMICASSLRANCEVDNCKDKPTHKMVCWLRQKMATTSFSKTTYVEFQFYQNDDNKCVGRFSYPHVHPTQPPNNTGGLMHRPKLFS